LEISGIIKMQVKKKPGEKQDDLIERYGSIEIKDNFVPVDEDDVARAVDVPYKEKITESFESTKKTSEDIKSAQKAKKKVKRNKKSVKKSSRKKGKKLSMRGQIENFKVAPVKLKPVGKGYSLIITEKPQAAEKIAEALAEGKVLKNSQNNVSYYTLQRKGKDIQVACAVGHLFSLAQVRNGKTGEPMFDIKWAPNYLVRKNDFTKRYYEVISKLVKSASEIIVATDYDIEGEVIGINVVRYICNQEDAQRMKFSTLTSKEIQEAYEERSKTLDWGQGIAGETRHYLDWIYGINLSRALMEAIKSTGRFRLMSIGRVQGPALHIIVDKEKEIQKFISEKYWQVFLDISDGENKVQVKHNKDISKEKELPKFNELKGKEGKVEVKKSQQKISPNTPFDLTSLQTEAYRLYKITPSKTLQIAQRLYLLGVISYPRTSSQKIPKEIGYEEILNRLKKRFSFASKISRKNPVEGKKSDPAHPSIYPTGEFHVVEGEDEKIYELIVRRFVSCFYNDAIVDNKKINFVVDNLQFNARGLGIKEKGWMEIYPVVMKEKELPDLKEKAKVEKVIIEEKMTQPPRRYSPASIVSELEKKNLGTKATRANIVETLYQREYIKEKSIEATSLGISLINTLEKNCPVIIDEKLTRDIEKNLEKIRNSKKPQESEEKILDESKKSLIKIIRDFGERQKNIGEDLVGATDKLFEQKKKDSEIMDCPECKKGKMALKYSKKFGKYFLGCTNYPECTKTFNLPPSPFIKKAGKDCPECNYPMLMSLKKGKRPWTFCFNSLSHEKKED